MGADAIVLGFKVGCWLRCIQRCHRDAALHGLLHGVAVLRSHFSLFDGLMWLVELLGFCVQAASKTLKAAWMQVIFT
jgi:hypothetical protein